MWWPNGYGQSTWYWHWQKPFCWCWEVWAFLMLSASHLLRRPPVDILPSRPVFRIGIHRLSNMWSLYSCFFRESILHYSWCAFAVKSVVFWGTKNYVGSSVLSLSWLFWSLSHWSFKIIMTGRRLSVSRCFRWLRHILLADLPQTTIIFGLPLRGCCCWLPCSREDVPVLPAVVSRTCVCWLLPALSGMNSSIYCIPMPYCR